MLRSARIKWARAVEHQRVLARHTREFAAAGSYDYVRTDNVGDGTDPLLKVHWRLKIKQPFPERWSVLVGDILTNLRATVDHAFWAAAVMHSGQPARPHQLTFPITTDATSFARKTRELSSLVAPEVWELVDAVQPFHGGDQAYTSPLEVLRWLSNIDKHRFVHMVGRTVYDFGSVLVRSSAPLEVVEEWRCEGQVDDNAVVARLKLRRPRDSGPIDLVPTFAHTPSIQISEAPVEFRSLASAMDAMHDAVLAVLVDLTGRLGEPYPDGDDLNLGVEHEAVGPGVRRHRRHLPGARRHHPPPHPAHRHPGTTRVLTALRTTARSATNASGRRRGEPGCVEERGELLQIVGTGPVVNPGPAPLGVDQAGFAQHLEMVGDGRPGEVERGGQVAHAGLAVGRGDQGQQP